MIRSVLSLFLTVAGALAVYYLWSVLLQLNDTVGMLLSIFTAAILSFLLARLRGR